MGFKNLMHSTLSLVSPSFASSRNHNYFSLLSHLEFEFSSLCAYVHICKDDHKVTDVWQLFHKDSLLSLGRNKLEACLIVTVRFAELEGH